MSEYAEIVDNKVVQVLVIDDNWSEEQAQEFLAKVSSNKWIKTNEKVGKSFEYHPGIQKFSRKKPFDSWVFDEKRGMYLPPIPKPLSVPIGYIWRWSEELRQWVLEKIND